EGIDRSVALSVDPAGRTGAEYLGADRDATACGRVGIDLVADRLIIETILVPEDCPDVGRRLLLAGAVHHALHGLAEFDLQSARQLESVFGFEQIGDATFARLAVHADDRFVAA